MQRYPHDDPPTDELDIIPEETVKLPEPGRRGRRRRKRGWVVLLAVLLLLGGIAGGGMYLYRTFVSAPDFAGPGSGDVVVRVGDGDSTTKIGNVLTQRGVVASAAAFRDAAADDDRIRSVQPGYYQLRKQMSAASAVAMLLDPASRVGQLEIRGGVQLDDTRAPDGAIVAGVLSLISKATCATLDGKQSCVSVDELRNTMAKTEPAKLGVPEWAL